MSGKNKSVDESSHSEEVLEQSINTPRNLVEVETSSDSWKTEFENEISSIRINGEEVTKLHQAVGELRKLREKEQSGDKEINAFDHRADKLKPCVLPLCI